MPECDNSDTPKLLIMSKEFASNPMPGRSIRVIVPASVANNLEKMQGITKTVLGRLGCTPCHSGFDLRFLTEEEFKFNEQGQLLE
jgi:hypothetical protein